MGTPRCSRCRIEAYGGEITLDVRSNGGATRTSTTKSYCGYCLPVVSNQLQGIISDHTDVGGLYPGLDGLAERAIISKE